MEGWSVERNITTVGTLLISFLLRSVCLRVCVFVLFRFDRLVDDVCMCVRGD
jgi:hypothetical protein